VKKYLLAILLVLMMLLAVAPLAWADDSGSGTQASVSGSAYGIPAELQTLQGLCSQVNALDQQLQTQTQTNMGLLKQIFSPATEKPARRPESTVGGH
jgi:hypothetical protein